MKHALISVKRDLIKPITLILRFFFFFKFNSLILLELHNFIPFEGH